MFILKVEIWSKMIKLNGLIDFKNEDQTQSSSNNESQRELTN